MRWMLIPFALGFALPAAAQASAADTVAIRRAAEDYINGFYAGDTTRMRRALHPDLVKRQASGAPGALALQTPDDLVGLTARMAGRAPGVTTPADSIQVLDVFRDIATVRIGVPQWVDYLQIARVGQEWRIVNVLWQLRG